MSKNLTRPRASIGVTILRLDISVRFVVSPPDNVSGVIRKRRQIVPGCFRPATRRAGLVEAAGNLTCTNVRSRDILLQHFKGSLAGGRRESTIEKCKVFLRKLNVCRGAIVVHMVRAAGSRNGIHSFVRNDPS